MSTIPPDAHDLFERETFAAYVTLDPDGSPQVTPVWIDHDLDSGHVLVNTAEGRRKDRNVAKDPRVAVCVMDPSDPYRYLSIEGRAERSKDGAAEHIDSLARRYMDVDEYPHHGEERGPRVIHRITPARIIS